MGLIEPTVHKGIRNILSAFFWSIERVAVCIGSGLGVFASSSAAESLSRTLDALLENHCLDCRDDVERKGGLDFYTLDWNLADPHIGEIWVKVHDRLVSGEMPPKKKSQLTLEERGKAVSELAESIVGFQEADAARQGRSVSRRVNRFEYQNILRDILHDPTLKVADQLPLDGEVHGFPKVGSALDVSHVQLDSYLDVAEFALRRAFEFTAEKPEPTTNRYYAREWIDQFQTAVRSLEQRLSEAQAWETRPKAKVDEPMPEYPEDKKEFFEMVRIMNDMSRLAFQTDSTRVITLFLGGQRTPGVNFEDGRSISGYHNLSHHGKDEMKLAELEEIEIGQMDLFGEFLRDLQDVKETDGSLLDNTMALYGCHMGGANIHNNINLPIILAGGGFRHGQHLAYNPDINAPLPNLFVSMLHNLGIEREQFTSSNGPLLNLARV